MDGIIEKESNAADGSNSYKDAEESQLQAHLQSMEQRLREQIHQSLQVASRIDVPPGAQHGVNPLVAPTLVSAGTLDFGRQLNFHSHADTVAPAMTPATAQWPALQMYRYM